MISDLEKEDMEHPQVQPDAHWDKLFTTPNLEEPWYKSLVRGIRETINPPKLPPLELTSKPLVGSGMDDIEKIEQFWLKSLIANIKDLVHPPKLPPLEVTSKPVEVGSIWGAYGGGERRSGATSILIHVGVVVFLLVFFQTPVGHKVVKNITDIYYVPPYQAKLPPAKTDAGGGGGGGMKAPVPVSKGEAPKMAKVFVPPTLAIPEPKLPVVPTITAPAPVIIAPQYGDPLSKLDPTSGGQGAHGLGNGTGGGVGNGNGDGYGPGSGGGMGGGVYRIGGEVSAPVLVNKVEPEYSEEARKAKYSGEVLLSIVVDANGLPRDIKIIRPLGLGLDEKAIEAVAKWRFRAGMKGGRPVATQAQVIVNFRLL